MKVKTVSGEELRAEVVEALERVLALVRKPETEIVGVDTMCTHSDPADAIETTCYSINIGIAGLQK